MRKKWVSTLQFYLASTKNNDYKYKNPVLTKASKEIMISA
jgi:hypothetical protein